MNQTPNSTKFMCFVILYFAHAFVSYFFGFLFLSFLSPANQEALSGIWFCSGGGFGYHVPMEDLIGRGELGKFISCAY